MYGDFSIWKNEKQIPIKQVDFIYKCLFAPVLLYYYYGEHYKNESGMSIKID